MEFRNVYEDPRRAKAYARLEFPGTYYLAFRDLPGIVRRHVTGTRALDFGCGAGRSTRFVRDLGFEVVGIDISAEMLGQARARDPVGDYRQVPAAGLDAMGLGPFDLVFSAFPFDNIPGAERKVELFAALGRMLAPAGRIVSLVSSPEIYVHEWASFSTRDYPENRSARSGDPVRIVQTDIDDPRPVVDILWDDDAYREVHARAGLEALATYRPLGRADEPHAWVNETRIAPWTIHVLGRGESRARPEGGA
jgi:SAM-dependent methyltransferase